MHRVYHATYRSFFDQPRFSSAPIPATGGDPYVARTSASQDFRAATAGLRRRAAGQPVPPRHRRRGDRTWSGMPMHAVYAGSTPRRTTATGCPNCASAVHCATFRAAAIGCRPRSAGACVRSGACRRCSTAMSAAFPTCRCSITRVTGFVALWDDSAKRLGTDYFDNGGADVHDLDEATHGPAFAQHFEALLDGGLPALAGAEGGGADRRLRYRRQWGVDLPADHAPRRPRRHPAGGSLHAGRYIGAGRRCCPCACATKSRWCSAGRSIRAFSPRVRTPAMARHRTSTTLRLPPKGSRTWRPSRTCCVCHDVPLRAAALQFPRAHRLLLGVLAGARTRTEFDDNLAMLRFPIPEVCWLDPRTQGLLSREAPLPGASLP